MATIRDVAKVAGVAVSTVSLALNQRERVSNETFRKVMEAADATGYVANPLAKSLRVGSSPFISLIVADIRTAFAQTLLVEVERRVFGKGYLVTVSDNSGEARDEAAVLRKLVSQRVTGVLLTPTLATHDHLADLRKASIPTVLFDRQVPDAGFDFVGLDNRLATGILVRHLARLGHRSIGFIGGTDGLWTADEREAGFREAMQQNALDLSDHQIASGAFTRRRGYQAATKLLCDADPVTGIVVANNEMMLGAMRAAKDLGFSVPEDVSLCCVDGAPWGDVLRPKITHVSQPVEAMAAKAADWLLERVDDKSAILEPRTVAFEPLFVLGESCGPPRTRV